MTKTPSKPLPMQSEPRTAVQNSTSSPICLRRLRIFNGGYTYTVAINMDGQIYAEQIIGKLGKVVELEAEKGTIAGWNIGEDALYKDFGNYRAYIQNPTSKESWIFSVQEKKDDGGYYGNFYVTTEGKVWVKDDLRLGAKLTDDDGDTIINVYDKFVFGHGAWNKNYETYYEGGSSFYLRYGQGGQIAIQDGTSDIFEINRNWKVNGVSMPTIHSHSDFLLSAPDGKAIFLGASGGIYLQDEVKCSDSIFLNLRCTSDGVAPIGVDKYGKICGTSSSERYKENITVELDAELNPHRLYDLPVVQYNYKDEFKNIELVSGTQIGITAENVEKYYPNALIRNKDGQAESWQDRIMIPAMLKLIQEQKAQIDSLAKRVEVLEKRQN